MASSIALDISLSVQPQHRDIEIAVDRASRSMSIYVEKGTPVPREYEGPYAVTPRLYYGTVLATKGLLMRDNVNVSAIPIHDVSNPAGGRTVTIGTV